MSEEVQAGGETSGPEVDLAPELREQIRAFAERLPDMDYYVVLGLARDADVDAIRRAFFQRSKTYHPDRYFNKNLGSYGPLLNEIYKRVVAAHEVIRDDKLRREYDKTLGPPGPAAPEVAALEPSSVAAAEEPSAAGAAESAAGEGGSAEPPAAGVDPAPPDRVPRKDPPRSGAGRSLRGRAGFRSRSGILQELESRLARSRARAAEHFEVAKQKAERREWSEAVQRVRTCLAFDPREKEYHEALAEWVQEANARQAQRVRKTADRLLHEGNVLDALPHLDEAVQLCPTDARLAHQLASLLLEVEKELDRALEFIGRAVELEVDEPAHYKLRARLYLALGAEREARRDLQRAWELDPMDKDVKAALAVQ